MQAPHPTLLLITISPVVFYRVQGHTVNISKESPVTECVSTKWEVREKL